MNRSNSHLYGCFLGLSGFKVERFYEISLDLSGEKAYFILSKEILIKLVNSH